MAVLSKHQYKDLSMASDPATLVQYPIIPNQETPVIVDPHPTYREPAFDAYEYGEQEQDQDDQA